MHFATNIIDFSKRPSEPDGLVWVEEDQLPNLFRGVMRTSELRVRLYRSPQQELGCVVGTALCEELARTNGLTLLGPQLLDAWQSDPSKIPADIRKSREMVYFWGIYRFDQYRFVRNLHWEGDVPRFGQYVLESPAWYAVHPAAALIE